MRGQLVEAHRARKKERERARENERARRVGAATSGLV